MKKLVDSLYTAADIEAMTNHIAGAVTIANEKAVLLSMKERKGGRQLGIARQGYVSLIQTIAANNIKELPRDKNPEELENLLKSYKDLSLLRVQVMQMLECIDDTRLAIGKDAILMADIFASVLKVARKDNSGLDMEMGEVDDYNTRFIKPKKSDTSTAL